MKLRRPILIHRKAYFGLSAGKWARDLYGSGCTLIVRLKMDHGEILYACFPVVRTIILWNENGKMKYIRWRIESQGKLAIERLGIYNSNLILAVAARLKSKQNLAF